MKMERARRAREQMTMRRIGSGLRFARLQKGVKQADLAEQVGIPVEALVRIEGGDSACTFTKIVKIAVALGRHIEVV